MLQSLLSSVITESSQVDATSITSGTYDSVVIIDTLEKLESMNDQLRELLDAATLELLLEKDAETNLELLQLSDTLEDIVDLIRAVRPGGQQSEDLTDAGAINLLVDVIENTTVSDHNGLSTRSAIAQFARFKALNTMIETYEGNLWEAIKQAAVGTRVWELWGRDTQSTIQLKVEDVMLFDDVDLYDYPQDPVSGIYRVGRGREQKKHLVWIEWKNYEASGPGMPELEPPKIIVERIRKLALLLNDHEKPTEFCVPHCLGYLVYPYSEDEGPGPLGLVFEVPRHVSAGSSLVPSSLLYLFKSQPDIVVLARLELALKISSCVLYFHSVNWLHKGLRSRSIMFFPDNTNQPRLQEPMVSGFDYSRPATSDDMTERPTDDPHADIYRHPIVQSTGNRDEPSARWGSFRKVYDIYSLGVVLIEIAFWKDISEILNINLETARPKQTWSVMNRLLSEEHVSQGVSDYLGPEYWEVCKACIEGAKSFGLGREYDERDPIIAATLQAGFYRKVVRRLRYLVAGRSAPYRS